MLHRGGSRWQLHWGLKEAMKMLPRKPQSRHERGKRRKIYGTEVLFGKQRTRFYFSFEEFVLPLEPIPTREVTGSHTGSSCHSDFFLLP